MGLLYDRVQMTTATTGTGTITLGSAVAGFQSFAAAGVPTGTVVRYVIQDSNNWEIGTGTYTSSGTTLSRTVMSSSNSGSAISLSGSAVVFISMTAEDIVVQSDDPLNASGLGAPAIINGTVYAAKAAGVTVGSGQTTTVQQATFTGLQNAINYASSNNKFFEIEGYYEIDGAGTSNAGLTVPASSSGAFTWRGYNATLVQFATNCSVLTLGDNSGTNTVFTDFDGVTCRYGVSQSGQTSAQAFVIGKAYYSRFRNINIDGATTGYNPNIAFYVAGSGGFFSNRLADITITGAQTNLLYVADLSTGNVWERVHMHQGSTTPVAITGPALQIGTGSGAGNGSVFEQVNVEHCLVNNLISLQGARGISFISLHIEDIAGTGSYPTLININDCPVNIQGLDILDQKFRAADGMTGQGIIFKQYYNDPLMVNGLLMQWVAASSQLDQQFYICSPSGYGIDYPSSVNIRSMDFHDYQTNNIQTYLNIDGNIGTGDCPIFSGTVIDNYTYRSEFSLLDGITMYPTGSYNYYGQIRGARIIYPASLAASCTLSLKNHVRSSGNGATTLRTTGDVVTVRRAGGTAANTLTITNDGGTTLTTNTTAATSYFYQFNGTNWVAVT